MLLLMVRLSCNGGFEVKVDMHHPSFSIKYFAITKVMISDKWQKVTQKAVRWPSGVCGRGIGNNSMQCTRY